MKYYWAEMSVRVYANVSIPIEAESDEDAQKKAEGLFSEDCIEGWEVDWTSADKPYLEAVRSEDGVFEAAY